MSARTMEVVSLRRVASSLGLRRGALVLSLLPLALGTAGCQRGEKSCRYFSLVLEKGEDPEERKAAIGEIRHMSTADQLKCDDDKVFERFATIVEKEPKYRAMLVEALESVGKANDKLRARTMVVLNKGLAFDDSAPMVANIIRNWRVESNDSGKDWYPEKKTVDALGAALRRIKDGDTKGNLLEALWLSLPDDKSRASYEDLLVELADADPAQVSIQVTMRALKYLTALRTKSDAAFGAYVRGLFRKDAAGAEAYGQARLALAVIPPEKVLPKLLGIFEGKDEEFAKWAKEAGLFDWEWQEGPKLAQTLGDLQMAAAGPALVARAAKAIDASEEGTPKTYAALKPGFPWSGYITSRLQLTMWGIAALGEGASGIAAQIGALASSSGPTVEQRTMPFIGLAISGASNSWPEMLKAFQAIPPQEQADFMTPLSYALEPQNLAEWQSVIVASKAEGVQVALADATIKGRVTVVEQCKQQVDAAADDKAKMLALANCYAGFLKNGDAIAKEKSAIGLVHLGAKGVDIVPTLIEAYARSQPVDVTLRQVMWAGFKSCAQPNHLAMLYKLQQLQVQIPNNETWDWEFDILLNHLASRIEAGGGAPAGGAAPAGAAAPAPAEGGAAAPAPAEGGAAPAAN